MTIRVSKNVTVSLTLLWGGGEGIGNNITYTEGLEHLM